MELDFLYSFTHCAIACTLIMMFLKTQKLILVTVFDSFIFIFLWRQQKGKNLELLSHETVLAWSFPGTTRDILHRPAFT